MDGWEAGSFVCSLFVRLVRDHYERSLSVPHYAQQRLSFSLGCQSVEIGHGINIVPVDAHYDVSLCEVLSRGAAWIDFRDHYTVHFGWHA
jgi:hypothetical protein